MTYLLFAVLDLLSSGSTVALRLMLVLACALAALAVAARVRRAAAHGQVRRPAPRSRCSAPHRSSREDPNTEQLGIAPLAGAWCRAARRPPLGRGSGRAARCGRADEPRLRCVRAGDRARALAGGRAPGAAGARERAARFGAALAGGALVATAVLGWLLLAGAIDDMWTQVVDKAGGALSGDSVEGASRAARCSRAPRGLFVLGAAGAALALSRPRLRAVARRRCCGPCSAGCG